MPDLPKPDAVVDLLVQTGVVTETDRHKTLTILKARNLLLNELSFGPAANELDNALAAWHHAAAAIHAARDGHALRLAALEPLRFDPRCVELFHRLEMKVHEYAAACANLAPPSGLPGREFMRLDHECAAVIKELQQVVGP